LFTAASRADTESRSAWEWFQALRLADAGQAQYLDFALPPSVFDKARADLGDLRLYDANGQENPYALRVRRSENRQEALAAREFNRAQRPDRSVEVSLDLGERTGEHNEIDLQSGGNDFRRRVQLEGSDTGKSWSNLLDRAYLVRFPTEPQLIDVHKLRYPPSRFRYLRVRVYPDTSLEADNPTLQSAVVLRTTQVAGEYQTLPARLGVREPERGPGGAPASAWTIDFGGEAAPCERLSFDVSDEDFVRAYSLETAQGDEPRRVIASSEWRRRAGAERQPLEIQFPEVMVRGLRLVVTDYRNPPLTVTGVRYTAPVRQVVFARSGSLAIPLRLYFGNPRAEPPHYDFAANLPGRLEPPPVRAGLEGVSKNPDFQPVPKPWTERWPWLVYVVLGMASLVLLAILVVLAREAVLRHDLAEQVAQRPSA
jgi:hypothetical protein